MKRPGRLSLFFLLAVTLVALTAEIWSGRDPVVLRFRGRFYVPAWTEYAAASFGQYDRLEVDYARLELGPDDWAWWPPVRWGPSTINKAAAEYPAPPSRANWLGTDDRGRDLFSRLLYGFRNSLFYALLVTGLTSALALVYGGACGFFGGAVDRAGQSLVEILAMIPQLLLTVYLLSIFEPSLVILIFAASAFGWIGASYLVRAEVLRVRALPHVEAATALGARRGWILRRYVLPNCLRSLVTLAPFQIIAAISGLAALDFLGLGLPAPTASLGELLQQAQKHFTWAWWLGLYPAGVLFFTLLALARGGEGWRRALARGVALMFGLALGARSAFAATPATVWSAEATQSATFDHVWLEGQSLRVKVDRIELAYEHGRGGTASGSIDGVKSFARLGLKPARALTLTVDGGSTGLDDSQSHRHRTDPYGALDARFDFSGGQASLGLSSDFVWREWVAPNLQDPFLRGDTARAGLNLHPSPRAAWVTTLQSTQLDDGNTRENADSNVMFEVTRGRFRSRVGPGLNATRFTRRSSAYWSPRGFVEYALRTQGELALHRRVSGLIALNVGRGDQIDGTAGLDVYAQGRLDVTPTKDVRIGVDWTHLEARRPGGDWSRNDVAAHLSAEI